MGIPCKYSLYPFCFRLKFPLMETPRAAYVHTVPSLVKSEQKNTGASPRLELEN